MIPAGFLAALDNPWRTACLGALAIALVQTARIDGVPVIGGGLKAELAASERQSQARLEAHVQTIRNYRTAQEQAAAAEKARVDRVRAEQKEISDDVLESYQRRLAALRARADELRRQGAAGSAGAAGGVAVPGVAAAASGAAEAACDNGFPFELRLAASSYAVQLDELITWFTRQSEVDPNR